MARSTPPSIAPLTSARSKCSGSSVAGLCVHSLCWTHRVVEVEHGGPCQQHGGAHVKDRNPLPRQCPDADERPPMRTVDVRAGCFHPLECNGGCDGWGWAAWHTIRCLYFVRQTGSVWTYQYRLKRSVGSRSERVDVPVHITGIYVTYSMFRGGYT